MKFVIFLEPNLKKSMAVIFFNLILDILCGKYFLSW